MTYSLRHITRGTQHALVLVDNVTTLPALFAVIYTSKKLSLLKFNSQKKELISIKFFYSYWLKKTGSTLDHSIYTNNFQTSFLTNELDCFFQYLLSKQHLTENSKIDNISYFDTDLTKQARVSYAEHVRTVARFLTYLNNRYMSLNYQDRSISEVNKIEKKNSKNIKNQLKEMRRLRLSSASRSEFYRNITLQQSCKLNDMLLPSLPAVLDADTGTLSNEKINPSNPFKTPFIQFRNYIIHRLMFNYGLRVGEVLLLTLQSFGVSQVNSNGNIQYLLSVQNLPDSIDDPRNVPMSLKSEYSTRIIELNTDDYIYITFFVERYRSPLFNDLEAKNKRVDSKILFTTSRGKCSPLSYHAISKIYNKIDNAFIKLYPHFRHVMPLLDMPYLTPHVGRHTWASQALEFIYMKLMNDEITLNISYGISGRMTGLLDAAADQLRILGGWSPLSKMPYRYAKRFLAKVANDSNLKRINY